ncbi:hypothetical protein Cpir12675_000578 [Ceratocystis pirilliformis]|uniref:Uncharacterized protein n=1 Tax=Ceratocystis pirilliformis TaxID=259994 RepID=A0ABR3ZM00_9PEZI
MKSPFSFLSTFLSFFGLHQTNLIEDHGYQLKTIDHLHMIRSSHLYYGREYVNAIGFTPEAKAATIYIANNDQEPMHEDKLSLSEIYNTLCENEGLEPENMKWITFDVNDDPETDGIISIIHKKRGIDRLNEVVILPDDMEWDLIVRTEYYQLMEMVTAQSPQKILLRHYSYVSSSDWELVLFTNCIYFSFESPEDTISTGQSGWPFDDEDQREAVFFEEQDNEFSDDSDDSDDFESSDAFVDHEDFGGSESSDTTVGHEGYKTVKGSDVGEVDQVDQGSEIDQGSRDFEDSENDDETNSRWFSLKPESPLAHPQV